MISVVPSPRTCVPFRSRTAEAAGSDILLLSVLLAIFYDRSLLVLPRVPFFRLSRTSDVPCDLQRRSVALPSAAWGYTISQQPVPLTSRKAYSPSGLDVASSSTFHGRRRPKRTTAHRKPSTSQLQLESFDPYLCRLLPETAPLI